MKISPTAPCPCGSGRPWARCGLAMLQGSDLRIDLTPHVPPPVARALDGGFFWEADAVPVNTPIDGHPGGRPVALFVSADRTPLRFVVLRTLSGEVEDVALELAHEIRQAAASLGHLPREIRVRHRDLARVMGSIFQDEPPTLHVEPAGLGYDDLLANCLQSVLLEPVDFPVFGDVDHWSEWGLPDETAHALIAAASALHRAGLPFDLDPCCMFELTVPSGRSWYMKPLPIDGDHPAIVLHRDLDDALAWMEFESFLAEPNLYLKDRGYIVHWERWDQLSDPLQAKMGRTEMDRTETDRTERERPTILARPEPYPWIQTVNTPGGGLRAADGDALVRLLGAVTNWARAGVPGFDPDWIESSHLGSGPAPSERDPDTGAWIRPERLWRDPKSGIEIRFRGRTVTHHMASLHQARHRIESRAVDVLIEAIRVSLRRFGGGTVFNFLKARAASDPALRSWFDGVLEGLAERAGQPTGPDHQIPEWIGSELGRQFNDEAERSPVPGHHGYTAMQLAEFLLQDWRHEDWPIRFRDDLDDVDAPVLHNARVLLAAAVRDDGLPVDPSGALAPQIARELYRDGHWDPCLTAALPPNPELVESRDLSELGELVGLLDRASLIDEAEYRLRATVTGEQALLPGSSGRLLLHLFITRFRDNGPVDGDMQEIAGEIPMILARLDTEARDWVDARTFAPRLVLPRVRLRVPEEDLFGLLHAGVFRPLRAFGLLEIDAEPDAWVGFGRPSPKCRVTPLFDALLDVQSRPGGASTSSPAV